MKNIFFILLFSTSTLNAITLTEEDKNPSAEKILIKKPEKHLRHESMIYNFNSALGVKDQRKYTGQDRNKLALAGHLSSNYEHFDNLLGFEINYLRKSSRYDKIWWGAQFFSHNAKFDAITQNHSVGISSNSGSESANQRPNGTENSVMGAGLGMSYRFKLLLDFFNTEDVFETIDVFANYIRLDEKFIDQTYQGYGLTANYGIHKRSGTSFFYGGKISYNLASVTREAINDEKKKDRSLTLGWLSVALELGVFF
ncbi:MAG: hypothetical protein WDA09_09380 [Bacteriovoracaceae bacterium]